jgi:hypothetical protein
LTIFKKKTFDNFGVVLITKSISVKVIYENGHDLRIAKMKSSESLIVPAIGGDGLNFAYNWVNRTEDNSI